MNRSYRIGYNFQRRVKKYLEKQGFNLIIRPKSKFPDITAYKIMGVQIETEINHADKKEKLFIDPFIVFDVECKVNKYLTKEEKEIAKKRLEEKKCNAFFVAYRKKRKLLFYQLFIKNNKIEIKNEKSPGYIG